MKIAARTLFGLHVAALGLGLFGILFAIPHSGLWTHKADLAFFTWALQRGGSSSMVTGALAMIAWGIATIGLRRTLAFAAIACTVSAAAELTGTATGWPFGGYEYLTFLDWKLAGRVPYGVPLSWFYMGFASYVLALAIVPARAPRRELLCLLLGAWLLTTWDLVLDPAMVALPQIKFWVWHEHGAYYGMPLRNLVGWFGTGLAFMALARFAWRTLPEVGARDLGLPFALYAVNIVWSMALAIGAGIWPPAVAAVALSLVPAALALRKRPRGTLGIA
jgi:putative membrane protein